MAESSPALCSTSTLCPAVTNAWTPAGVMPTRLSWSLTSFGTPITMPQPYQSAMGLSVSPEGSNYEPRAGNHTSLTIGIDLHSGNHSPHGFERLSGTLFAHPQHAVAVQPFLQRPSDRPWHGQYTGVRERQGHHRQRALDYCGEYADE